MVGGYQLKRKKKKKKIKEQTKSNFVVASSQEPGGLCGQIQQDMPSSVLALILYI
jgi:hypothetical protein